MNAKPSMLTPQMLFQPTVFWLTAAGLGLLRPAPGTWGSAGAVVFWWFFLSGLAWPIQLAIVLLYFLLSWWLCNRLIEQLGIEDEPQIVADEVAGMWWALIWLPQSLGWCWAAFLLFRLADIFKPGPIGVLDRNLHSGLGIMADDMLAGGLTALVLALAALALALP
ncbi:MAG: phosphatidylglycerophosphatase A [Proteobacteria bacterium]|nr:phosphatidylglycerophosphatase A [Pseudomonadota bacterium]